MSLFFLNDPSFWILISFLLLMSALSRGALKKLHQQLKTRQETIARQITEVSALYEEAKNLLAQAKETLKNKEKEALLLHKETLKERERKKQSLKNTLEKLHQKYEDDLYYKIQMIQAKHAEEITKKIIEESCIQAEDAFKKNLNQQASHMLMKTQIEKINF